MAEQIIERATIRAKFEAACLTNAEFDALEQVSRSTGLSPETVAEIVAEEVSA